MPFFIREEPEEQSGQESLGPRTVEGTSPDNTGDTGRNDVQKPVSVIRQERQKQEQPEEQENVSGPQQEYLTVASRNKNVRRSTILLVGLFVIGMLCLWFMIKKSSPGIATASLGQVNSEEAQIEKAITRIVGVRSEMFNRMGEIVKKFYEFSDVQQVDVTELVKNPFKLEIFLGDLDEKSDTEDGSLSVSAEIMRQERLRQQTKDMQLFSIMTTDEGKCCMINDMILYEGDSIKGFNVHQIGDSTVLLASNGVEVILKLTE